ncbi:MAG: response regulator transcription factor [Candidatus Dormibacteraeota bacterium]|nr:response regulator transcription factor [Candidatus Dormibacteraeota bacterium]
MSTTSLERSTSTVTPIRVLVVDDQTLFRAGLSRLLSQDPRIEVAGEAADGAEAVRLVDTLKPDVVLMDLKMPHRDGIHATRQIVHRHPETKVLILTTYDGDNHVIQALRAGASGYMLKDANLEAIVSSLMAVVAGERVMATAVADRVLEMLTGGTTAKEFYDGLTTREAEILRMMANGMPNKQIAFELAISEKTVRNHVSNMYEKLGVYDRTQATLYAVRKGIIDL